MENGSINIIKSMVETLENEREKTSSKKDKEFIDEKLTQCFSDIEKLEKEQSLLTKKFLQSEINNLKKLRDKAEQENDLKSFNEYNKKLKIFSKKINGLQGEIKFLRPQQIKNMIKAIRNNSKTPLRDELLVSLGFELALRSTEIKNLKYRDVDFSSSRIFCKRLKGGVDNTIIVKSEYIEKLKKLKELENKSVNDFIFSSQKQNSITSQGIGEIIKKYTEMARIPKEFRHFHVLRHSKAVYLAEQGYTIQEIQIVLGHKEIRSTMVYFKFTKAQKEILENKLINDSLIF